MITKNELRKIAKQKRKSIDIKNVSAKIVEKIAELDIFKSAKNIMLFYPLKYEVDLLPLLDFQDKNFYLPKVFGENLLVCPYKKGDELSLSSFDTLEPKTATIDDETILDLIFVPALMTDKSGYRLGYGGGFYDKFLSKPSIRATKIVALSSELIIDELPHDAFDVKVDLVITEFKKE